MKRTQALLFILTFFVSPHLHAEAGADADEATSSVSMTDSDILEMHVGECCQLHTDIVPSDEQADGDFSVSWSSSHSGLWVDECGFITALAPCQATVVCTSSAGCDSCNIVVKPTTDGVLPCYGSESTVQLSSHSEDDAFRLSLVDDVLTVSCEFMADAGADGIISYAVCQNTIFLDIHTGHTDDTASCILRGTEFQIRDCTADYYYIYFTGDSGRSFHVTDFTAQGSSIMPGSQQRAYVRRKNPDSHTSLPTKDPDEHTDIDVNTRISDFHGFATLILSLGSVTEQCITISGTYHSRHSSYVAAERTTHIGILPAGCYTIELQITDLDGLFHPFVYHSTFTVHRATPVSPVPHEPVPVTSYDLSGRPVIHPAKGLFIRDGKKIALP